MSNLRNDNERAAVLIARLENEVEVISRRLSGERKTTTTLLDDKNKAMADSSALVAKMRTELDAQADKVKTLGLEIGAKINDLQARDQEIVELKRLNEAFGVEVISATDSLEATYRKKLHSLYSNYDGTINTLLREKERVELKLRELQESMEHQEQNQTQEVNDLCQKLKDADMENHRLQQKLAEAVDVQDATKTVTPAKAKTTSQKLTRQGYNSTESQLAMKEEEPEAMDITVDSEETPPSPILPYNPMMDSLWFKEREQAKISRPLADNVVDAFVKLGSGGMSESRWSRERTTGNAATTCPKTSAPSMIKKPAVTAKGPQDVIKARPEVASPMKFGGSVAESRWANAAHMEHSNRGRRGGVRPVW